MAQFIRLILATKRGAIPIKTTSINHKFPVVKSYALSNFIFKK